MVPVTAVAEEDVTVKIAMVPELEPVEESVEHKMTSEMVKEASVVTPVATTTAGVVVLTSNITVKIALRETNTKFGMALVQQVQKKNKPMISLC